MIPGVDALGDIGAQVIKSGGEVLQKPIVLEFGGDGWCLGGRKKGKTDNRVLIKRLEVPTVDALLLAVAGTVGLVALVAMFRSNAQIDEAVRQLPILPGIDWGPLLEKTIPKVKKQ